ncbi:amidohydrolase family protein [Parasphaerochaeta coccoides]|uniref:S-adenosylhomocysteine deaminase n=1 Tax=Parasphaerochaeta coccoides (strain ATCC BAA-1237 / DSM 17374 / SPN1) TaxID=760011 RepID=F4GJD8_PARC1|nr:amidohydrolase [Parasphaerochaeta coccoides]AEC02203.1 S-adenosylhomocysteine deaminase [Parasphaerochaeta coccoides DSM 17374]
MKTLITHATILPMTQEGLFFQGDIGIEDKKIVFVGTNRPESFLPDMVIDATGMLALPAFVNAHTHLSMGLMRNYKDSSPSLQDWLAEIFPIEEKLHTADVEAASRLGAAELIRSGTTTFADMYFFAHETAKVVREAGMRACLGLTFFGDIDDSRRRFAERLPALEQEASLASNRIRIDAAPHAIYTTSAETYRYARDFVRERGCAFHTHLSETRKEVDDCVKETGMTPALYLESLGIFTVPSYLAHGVFITDEEISLLKDCPTAIVHNISSNLKLSSGVAPVAKFMRNGLTVAIGTDGASSNNNLNMCEELHVAMLVSRLFSAGQPPLPFDMLRAATLGGAQALGLSHLIGTLEVGKEADIILVSTQATHMNPLNDPFSAMVYSLQSSDIDTVFCQGKLLMHGGILQTVDESQACRDVNKKWNALLSR